MTPTQRNKSDKALKAAALKATQDEWQAFTNIRSGTCAVHTPRDKGCCDIIDWPGFDGAAGSKRQKVANAKYIALANPQTVLKLLERVEVAEAKVVALEASPSPAAGAKIELLLEEIKTVLRDAIAGTEKSAH